VIKSAGEILVDEIGKCVANFQRSVTPIFDVNSKGEAKLLGSGVLIEISNNVFLCTAKHVIDRNAKSTLYIDGPTHFEVLQGSSMRLQNSTLPFSTYHANRSVA
jgi:hypothetical protein